MQDVSVFYYVDFKRNDNNENNILSGNQFKKGNCYGIKIKNNSKFVFITVII